MKLLAARSLRAGLIVALICLQTTDLLLANTPGERGSIHWSLTGAAVKAFEPGVGLGGAAEGGVLLGVGEDLCLTFRTSMTQFTQSRYLLDLSLSLTGFLHLSDRNYLVTGGGLGIAFSDLPQWEQSNRALSAHIVAGLHHQPDASRAYRMSITLRKAATSTGNVTLASLGLSYFFKL